MTTHDPLLDKCGQFTWSFGHQFFVETDEGNFIWSDPDYNGDNTFVKYAGSYEDWARDIPMRCKGKHVIGLYCGTDIKITR